MREAGVNLVSDRHLLLGAARARPRRVRLQLARRGHGPAARQRHRGRPGHRDRLAAAVAHRRCTPRSLPVTGDGSTVLPRRPPALAPELAGVPRARAAPGARRSPSATRDHPAVVALARLQRARLPQRLRLLRRRRAARSAPGCEHRYGTLDALNAAWGTAFWCQRYGAWDEILPPRAAPSAAEPRPAARLPAVHLRRAAGLPRAERDVLRAVTPDMPGHHELHGRSSDIRAIDYVDWAAEVDIVSNDHYLTRRAAGPHDELAFAADLTRGLAGGGPWLLMEHSTSAVNWQPRNIAKRRASCARNSLAHVARGADAICFFQWRQSAPAPRSSTPRWCRTPAPTARLPRGRRARRRPRPARAVAGTPRVEAGSRSCSTGSPGGPASSTRTRADRLRYRQEALAWYTALPRRSASRVDVVPAGCRPRAATGSSSCPIAAPRAADAPAAA